ncbi:hypothetical protein PLIIFM63780_001051 [Purpureocillium lilacinum]|uniref:uncharacterized protein n=1 Tax=Purpureocillium lilacinum TaxID=33203 RepID=UPI0020893E82|nr:hypothetical protein PLICBS_002808 [Purpureocillium lilacinum]GJN77559.1 hypothetical protein PLIIFM63780_001051 [Purpureocillium lilacinum]
MRAYLCLALFGGLAVSSPLVGSHPEPASEETNTVSSGIRDTTAEHPAIYIHSAVLAGRANVPSLGAGNTPLPRSFKRQQQQAREPEFKLIKAKEAATAPIIGVPPPKDNGPPQPLKPRPAWKVGDPLRARAGTFEYGFFYRGDNRPPAQIFKEGFTGRGHNANILDHLNGVSKDDSAFVSVTRSRDRAETYAFGSSFAPKTETGYVYKISYRGMPDGYFIPQAKRDPNLEFMTPGRIPRETIVGCSEVRKGAGLGAVEEVKWTRNPKYKYYWQDKKPQLNRICGGKKREACDEGAGNNPKAEEEKEVPHQGVGPDEADKAQHGTDNEAEGGENAKKGKKPTGGKPGPNEVHEDAEPPHPGTKPGATPGQTPWYETASANALLQWATEITPKSFEPLVKDLQAGTINESDLVICFTQACSRAISRRYEAFSTPEAALESLIHLFTDAAAAARSRTVPAGFWMAVVEEMPAVARRVHAAKTPEEKMAIARRNLDPVVRVWLKTPLGAGYEALASRTARHGNPGRQLVDTFVDAWEHTPVGYVFKKAFEFFD